MAKRDLLDQCLTEAARRNASDVHLTAGRPPVFRVGGELVFAAAAPLLPEEVEMCLTRLARPRPIDPALLRETDFACTWPGCGRLRVNAFRQQGRTALALRRIADRVLTPDELDLPPIVAALAVRRQGLILAAGPAGSGKSTTLAALVETISRRRACHILTLEDPIEYVYGPGRGIIHQREIGGDTASFASALRAALREDPDVILVGELRDEETMLTALTAAETGHLVLSTLHTASAMQAVQRIADSCSPRRQAQIRIQLSLTLQAILSQRLLRRRAGPGRIAAMEILLATDAVRHLIREGKTHQLPSQLQTGASYGMQTFEQSVAALLRRDLIASGEAEAYLAEREWNWEKERREGKRG